MLSGFVQSETPNDFITYLVLVLLPIRRIEASYFSVAEHLLPIPFDSLVPIQLFLLVLMQDLQIAPTFLVGRLVLVAEGSETKRRRALGGIGEDRDCVVKISLIAKNLIIGI